MCARVLLLPLAYGTHTDPVRTPLDVSWRDTRHACTRVAGE